MKRKVLIFAGYYIPSVKGGGPIQSIKNIVDNLSDKFDFYIVAEDRDLGDSVQFENIEVDKWIKVGNAKVLYIDRSKLSWNKVAEIVNESECDVMYLNSFFDFKFSIIPMILRKLNKIKCEITVVAPRGQFSIGALGLKGFKKKVFINISKIFNFHKTIKWHATAIPEKKDIERVFGNDIDLTVANNLTADYRNLEFSKKLLKAEGEIKIIFLSRVHPKKNIKKAIEYLKSVKGNVEFNIYGPIEDKVYWSECESIINELPDSIRVSLKGTVEHEQILKIFNEHHVFLFPTLAENFGHVISESLVGGCPVIISDQTPWKKLENFNVGWDIELTDDSRFVETIQLCIDMDNESYQILSRNAFEYGKSVSNNIEDIRKIMDLFN